MNLIKLQLNSNYEFIIQLIINIKFILQTTLFIFMVKERTHTSVANVLFGEC